MRLHSLFFVFFLWDLTAASQALSADPSDTPPPVETVVDRPNTDSPVTTSVNEPAVDYDWTGLYVGALVGYGWGSSEWSGHHAGGPSLNGST
jgi:hypothetical protein